MTAIIGYNNLLELGTLAASSENSSYPVANLADWLTVDSFKPDATGTVYVTLTLSSAKACDYLAFYGQSLYQTGGTIKLQYYDWSWHDASSVITPTDNAVQFVTFTQRSASQYRLVITTGSGIPFISVVAFGLALRMQYGMYLNYSEPLVARTPQLLNNISDGGSFLGRSVVAKGVSTNLILQYAQDAWVRTYWLPFVKHAEQKPFFFMWDSTNHAGEASYLWCDGNIPPPAHTHYGFMGATIPVKGLIE